MQRIAFLGFITLILSAASLLLGLNACGTTSRPDHVVVIFQENRTPDNLFHDPVLMARGADIADSGLDSSGKTVPLTPMPLVSFYDISHAHGAFVTMYDNGKMDGADKIPTTCYGNPDCNVPPDPQFRYVQASDVRPYFQMAEQYTFADRMFQTNEGPSFPAHQFIISGTSAPTATSNLFASENTSALAGWSVGCIAPAPETVMLVGPSGAENSTMYPCFEHPTLTDLLDTRRLSWRYYAPTPGSIWTAPNAIRHMCQPQTESGQVTCAGEAWKNVIIPQTGILTDIANHHLAQVSWVVPSGRDSDHPIYNEGTGPSWVGTIVNAIGNSSYWSKTVILITWDDWGGWYDHVRPPQVIKDSKSWGSGYVYGFRVPLIVISPYSKDAYISHNPHDFGSILKFIEEVFNLTSLGYADAYADDLSDCFNFRQPPLRFQTIQTPLSEQYFLSDQRPPTDPDND